jgi:Glycosyl hydrolase catalytic core
MNVPHHPVALTRALAGVLLLACTAEDVPRNTQDDGSSGSSGSSQSAGAGGIASGGSSVGAGASSGGATSSGGTANTGATTNTGGGAGTSNSGGGAGTSNSGGSASGGSAGALGASAYKGVANSECADLTTLNVSWWYNWTLSPGGCDKDEFVPMISGKNEKTPDAVAGALSSLANAGYHTVLGFNEPNKVDQANMTVDQVVTLWPSITSNPAIVVGSPSVSADARSWFEDFMAEVDAGGLRVDFVTIHWYGWNAGSCNTANELENHIVWAEQFGLPIWITEWGCMNQSNPTPEVVEAFYPQAIAMFAEHPLVVRYAWYPWNTNNELVDTGALTDLGNLFAAAPATK